jgi:hypothetical protein
VVAILSPGEIQVAGGQAMVRGGGPPYRHVIGQLMLHGGRWASTPMSMAAAQLRPALRCIVQSLRLHRATHPSSFSLSLPSREGPDTAEAESRKQKSAASRRADCPLECPSTI